jgi:hypothetical protein
MTAYCEVCGCVAPDGVRIGRMWVCTRNAPVFGAVWGVPKSSPTTARRTPSPPTAARRAHVPP